MKDDRIYLKHILDATQKIEKYVSVGEAEFMETTHWQDAVMRQLEIIGEATKNISEETRIKYSDVPWKRMAGMRDVLIHHYFGIDIPAVWEVTQKDIPELKVHISKILKSN